MSEKFKQIDNEISGIIDRYKSLIEHEEELQNGKSAEYEKERNKEIVDVVMKHIELLIT